MNRAPLVPPDGPCDQPLSTEESLRQYSRRLEVLLEIDRAILSIQEPRAITQAALKHIAGLVPHYRASCVFLFDSTSDEVDILAFNLAGDELPWLSPHRITTSELDFDLAALQLGMPYQVADLQYVPSLLPLQQEFQVIGIRSYLIVPLQAGGALIGTLLLASDIPQVFQAEQVKIAQEVADSLAIAIQQSRLLKAEQERRREAEIMRDIMAALASSVELKQVLEVILLNLGKVIRYDRAALSMLEDEPLSHAKDSMASEGFPQTTPLDDPIVEVLRRTRRPMIIADIRTDPRFRSWPGMELVRGWMGMPLFAGKEMIGVLSLAHLKPGAFTHLDAEVAELFTRQVADVLGKARQYEETHRRSEELELLSKFSLAIRHAESQENVLTALMEQTTRVFGANQGTFLLLDKDASTLMVSFSQDKSLVGEWHIHGKDLLWQVLRNDRPQFYSSLEKVLRENPHSFYQILFRGMQSAALVPLHTAEGAFGLLVFTFKELHNFSGEDQRLFSAIAEIAATALRRAAILEALETQVVTRTRHLSTFYEISAVTSEPADLEVLLPRVLRITLDAMNSHIGAIYLLEETQNRLHLTAQYNLPEEELPRFENLSLQTPFWRNLLLSAEPVIIPDLTSELRVPEGFYLPGNQAFLGAPVRAKGKPLGLLSMFGETILNYTIEDITLFTTIADQVGSVVERARLYKQAERAAVAEERQRLARELHDSVTQLIYSLVLYAGAGNKVLKQNNLELVDEYLARIHQTSLQALKEMRLLVYELRPSVFREEGLIGALHHRLKAVEERTGIKAELIADRDIEIDEATEQTLYRIAEEALNNTLKHAKASHVQIRLSAHKNRVQLSICDDGCGFNLEEGKKRGGLGLIGIDERARNLGGDLQITTAPGQGTTIIVNLEVVE